MNNHICRFRMIQQLKPHFCLSRTDHLLLTVKDISLMTFRSLGSEQHPNHLRRVFPLRYSVTLMELVTHLVSRNSADSLLNYWTFGPYDQSFVQNWTWTICCVVRHTSVAYFMICMHQWHLSGIGKIGANFICYLYCLSRNILTCIAKHVSTEAHG